MEDTKSSAYLDEHTKDLVEAQECQFRIWNSMLNNSMCCNSCDRIYKWDIGCLDNPPKTLYMCHHSLPCAISLPIISASAAASASGAAANHLQPPAHTTLPVGLSLSSLAGQHITPICVIFMFTMSFVYPLMALSIHSTFPLITAVIYGRSSLVISHCLHMRICKNYFPMCVLLVCINVLPF
jgi:hypothetical protein